MSLNRLRYNGFTSAEKSGFVLLAAACLLVFIDCRLTVVTLAGFIVLCLAAPFFPCFGFFLPVISRGRKGEKAVALTFDDGPDPQTTLPLLDLLRKYKASATFFVTGRLAEQHPDLIKEILVQGHTLGNHSYTHDNLLMFRSVQTIFREIETSEKIFCKFKVRTLAFRPPVGVTGPRLKQALLKSNHFAVNFNRRAFDGGNRWIKRLSERILKRIAPGDIILLHDVRPHPPSGVTDWLQRVEQILTGIKQMGFEIRPLDEIIGRPVMIDLEVKSRGGDKLK